MAEAEKKCPVCSGRGYFHCECWPGDCICGRGDEECDICEGGGRLFADEIDDLYEPMPTAQMEPHK